MKSAAPTTIDAYIANQPPEIQVLLTKIRQTIRKAAPTATETINYQMPTFQLNGNLVHFAAFKTHIGFYPTPSGIAHFQKELSIYKGAKGSVQFPLDKPMPLALIAKIVKFRVKETLKHSPAKPKSATSPRAKPALTNTKPSASAQVEAYMQRLKHPLADVLAALRQIILKTSPNIGEEIKWNAPTFFYTGEMPPSDPKKYQRYLVVSNLAKRDYILLVFLQGAKVNDTSGFLTGDYTDGRRLATFASLQEVRAKKKSLQTVLRLQLKHLEK